MPLVFWLPHHGFNSELEPSSQAQNQKESDAAILHRFQRISLSHYSIPGMCLRLEVLAIYLIPKAEVFAVSHDRLICTPQRQLRWVLHPSTRVSLSFAGVEEGWLRWIG